MEPTRKIQFEQIIVVVLLIVFGLTVKGVFQSLGGRKATPTTPTPAANAARSSPVVVTTQERASSQATWGEPRSQGATRATPRPDIVYTAETLRDPLISLLPPEPTRTTVVAVVTPRAILEPPVLTVQGLIWGGRRPQAVIDGEVYSVGETVNGATIVAITRKGVTVEVDGTPFQFTTNAGTQGGLAGGLPNGYVFE